MSTTLSVMNAARIEPRKPPTTGSYPGDVPKGREVSRAKNPNSGIASAKKITLETRNCVGLSLFRFVLQGYWTEIDGGRNCAPVRSCAISAQLYEQV